MGFNTWEPNQISKTIDNNKKSIKYSTMTLFTSNYETIKATSLKKKSVDPALISCDMTTQNQGKIQSTFLQSVLSNKFVVVLVVVVLGTGFMAYNTNPVASSNKFRSDDYAATLAGGTGGGITSRENGGKDDIQGFMFISTFNLQNVPPLPTESPKKSRQKINYVIIMPL